MKYKKPLMSSYSENELINTLSANASEVACSSYIAGCGCRSYTYIPRPAPICPCCYNGCYFGYVIR